MTRRALACVGCCVLLVSFEESLVALDRTRERRAIVSSDEACLMATLTSLTHRSRASAVRLLSIPEPEKKMHWTTRYPALRLHMAFSFRLVIVTN